MEFQLVHFFILHREPIILIHVPTFCIMLVLLGYTIEHCGG